MTPGGKVEKSINVGQMKMKLVKIQKTVEPIDNKETIKGVTTGGHKVLKIRKTKP